MKKSFLITTAIYLVGAFLLWKIDLSSEKYERKRLSLSSINLVPCSCNLKMSDESKQEPKAKPKPIVKSPKKVRKTQKKKRIKPVTKRKKVHPTQKQKKRKKAPPKKQTKPQMPPHNIQPTAPSPKEEDENPKVAQSQESSRSLGKINGAQEKKKSYLQQYGPLIRAAILRHICYPRLARKTKKEGEVVLKFSLLPNRTVENIVIVKSSGHSILDRAAKRTVLEARKEFPSPTKQIVIEVPIEYKIQK